MNEYAKAIYAYCLTCCGDSPEYVERCAYDTCPLHPFRLEAMPERKQAEVKLIRDVKRKHRPRKAVQEDNNTTEGDNSHDVSD